MERLSLCPLLAPSSNKKTNKQNVCYGVSIDHIFVFSR